MTEKTLKELGVRYPQNLYLNNEELDALNIISKSTNSEMKSAFKIILTMLDHISVIKENTAGIGYCDYH